MSTRHLFQRSLLTALLCAAPVVPALAGFEFVPPSRVSNGNAAPAMTPTAPPAAQAGMGMTPAPAASVVSEALDSAAAQTAPQSILPPAPAAPQAMAATTPIISQAPRAPAPSAAMMRNTRSAATPQGSAGPSINMNPLNAGRTDASAAPVSSLEQAMLASADAPSPMPAASGRAAMGGLPLPPASAANGTYADAVGFGRELPLALAVSQIIPPDYAFSFDGGVNPGATVSWEGGRPWNEVLDGTLSPLGASAHIDDAKKEITISEEGASVTPAAYTPPPSMPQAPRPPSAMPASAPAIMTPAPAVQDIAPVVAMPPAQPAPQRQLIGLAKPGGVLDTKAVQTWEAPRGSTLRTILTDWSAQAGVELFWSSDFDFPVESSLRINGTFEQAIQTLLSGLRDAQPRPIGRLHPNLPDGPSVLVIETKHVLE